MLYYVVVALLAAVAGAVELVARYRVVASLEADEQLGMEAKTRRLALVLLNVVGEDVLRASVEALGDEIR